MWLDVPELESDLAKAAGLAGVLGSISCALASSRYPSHARTHPAQPHEPQHLNKLLMSSILLRSRCFEIHFT